MSEKITVTAHIVIDLDPQELWENTFGTAGESWPHWREQTFLGDAEWDRIGRVRMGIEDPDDEEKTITKEFGLAEIVEAVQALVAKDTRVWGTPLIKAGDDLDWDASASDIVLQQIMLGEVVYG